MFPEYLTRFDWSHISNFTGIQTQTSPKVFNTEPNSYTLTWGVKSTYCGAI